VGYLVLSDSRAVVGVIGGWVWFFLCWVCGGFGTVGIHGSFVVLKAERVLDVWMYE
jgi:hypothetical protein